MTKFGQGRINNPNKTLVVAQVNPFQFILTRRMIGGKYNKWIVILQEFDLEFVSVKSKKSLIFVELIFDFPSEEEEEVYEDTFVDEHIFPYLNFGSMVWGYHHIFTNVKGPYSPITE